MYRQPAIRLARAERVEVPAVFPENIEHPIGGGPSCSNSQVSGPPLEQGRASGEMVRSSVAADSPEEVCTVVQDDFPRKPALACQ